MDLYLDFLARLLLTTLRTQMSRKADEDAIKTKDRARKGHEYAVSDVVYAAMQGLMSLGMTRFSTGENHFLHLFPPSNPSTSPDVACVLLLSPANPSARVLIGAAEAH